MSRKTLKTIATLAAVLATAVVVPAASASSQDLRSPDTSDAARAVVVTNGQDLRSPDAQDMGRPSATTTPSATPTDSGTDWGEIGMITGAVVLVLGGIGALYFVTRRRGHVRKSGATIASS
jgi:hypothetical protein